MTVIYRKHYEALTNVASMLILMTIMFVGVHLPLMIFARVMGDDDDDDDEDEHVSQSSITLLQGKSTSKIRNCSYRLVLTSAINNNR